MDPIKAMNDAPPDGFNYDTNIRIVQKVVGAASTVEIHEYKKLRGNIGDPAMLQRMNSLGLHLKRIKITLNNGQARAESGALHYKLGPITLETKIGGASGLAKKLITSTLTDESVVKPLYSGSGDIYLEPTFNYYLIVQLNNEEAVVDKGLYFASEGSIEVGVHTNKSVKTGLFGGEGFFQTSIKGTGWVVLCVPVPPDEIQKFTLINNKLSVDGDFAILRKGNIEFTVEKSAKGYFNSKATGEGKLQTFSGTGEVWICPTLGEYPQPPPPPVR